VIGSADLTAQRLPIKTYTSADGLAHNRVNRIVRDSRGLLWFCTADGLSRFDGYGFISFGVEEGLPHGSVHDLLETRPGEYWIATAGGLVRFDPAGQPRRELVLEGGPPASPSMFTVIVSADRERRGSSVTVLREGSDGTIWAGTHRGLYRVAGPAGQRSLQPVDIGMPNDLPEQSEVTDVLEDGGGSLWIATLSGLYRREADGRAARFGVQDGLPGESLLDLFEDRDRRLWVATRGRGFFRVLGAGTARRPVVDLACGKDDGLPVDWVTQLFEASDGRVWAGTAAGLAELVWRREGQCPHVRTYVVRNGLSHRYIAGLSDDRDGNLWLSTPSAGAMKLTRRGFTTFGEPDGIESINEMFEDGAGNLCFRGIVLGEAVVLDFRHAAPAIRDAIRATSHTRFGCFDGQRFHWIYPEAVANLGWVLEGVTLRARTGEWWLGHVGLFRFPPADRFDALQTARPASVYDGRHGLSSQVFRLYEDSHDNIWISTTSEATYGLARWEPHTGRVRDLSSAAGLPSRKDDQAHAFGEDTAGRIWIGFTGGLARYADDRFQFFSVPDGLPRGVITSIATDRAGRLWLASRSGGLVRVDDAGADRPRFVRYTTADGLSSNNIEAMVEDRLGRLYVGGGNGVDRLDPATGRIKHFGAAEGLPPGVLKAAFMDRQGVLWFGMSNGLARLEAADGEPNGSPQVSITGMRVDGVTRHVSALGESAISLADLAPDRNQVQIDFAAPGFAAGEVMRYQYRLEGARADWSVPAVQRTVTYARLSPGEYIFMVRAVNSDGVASVQPATVSFAVLRPVWQRWWFVVLLTVAVVLTLRATYRSRVARLLAIADMRTHIATDLHDDIGANLTRIALLSEAARQMPPAAPLASIARISRESVSTMSDIVWAISPKRESLLDLTRRMRQHAEEIFALPGTELSFNAAIAESRRLGMDVRRDLLLIFKEAVNNAARHSGASAVNIDLRLTGTRLSLVVADNGSGFDASRESDGQGLLSMCRRADRLGGALDVQSAIGSGTRVTLSVPV
jgi:ligand-binding sensor domain-containing protein/signal transduction histidine kinase